MRAPKTVHDPVIGGDPRVDLLPPEITAEQKGRRLRRGLAVAVVAVVLVTGVGIAAATWEAGRRRSSTRPSRPAGWRHPLISTGPIICSRFALDCPATS